MIRAVIYARVSTDAQERDGTSLDTQTDSCQEFAAARGWTVSACVRDAASGFVLERRGLEQASVHHLLKNSAYAGRTLYRRTRATSVRDPKTGRRRRQVAERPEAEWIEVVGASEAVVLPALWERVQERLADPERLRMGHRQSTYALAGHIRCAKCGRSMVGQTLQGSYRYYRCRSAFAGPKHNRCLSRYVRANALEGAVKTAVAGVLANPEVVLAELERFRRANEEAPRTRDAELEQLEAQRKDVLGRYQLGQIDDGYLEEELARTRRETERIRSHPVRPAANADGDYDIAAVCEGVRAWLEGAAGDNVALIAEALELEVRASPDEAELLGKLPILTHHWTNIGMTTWT